jgi:hypothetical protein
MKTRSLVLLLGTLSAATSVGCGGEPPPRELATESALITGGPHLMWWNYHQAGTLSAWLLSGGTVVGTQSLDAHCAPADDNCPSWWHVVDTRDNTILWYNAQNGLLSTWVFDKNGHVTFRPNMTWTCDFPSGCSNNWTPIGRVSLKPKGCSGICTNQDGLVWHNASTGELSVWKIASDGYTVTGNQSLSWRCGTSDGCSNSWSALYTADFDGDGSSDLLWYDKWGTGQLSVWLTKDSGGSIKGSQTLSWTQLAGQLWYPVVAGDANADNHTDLLWWNAKTGELASWLLNGAGTVTGTLSLSWTCSTNCNGEWAPIGYVTMPPPEPR